MNALCPRRLSIMLLFMGACVSHRTVRSSSEAHLPATDAQATLALTPEESGVLLTQLFRARGFERNREVPGADGTRVVLFTGPRARVTTVVATADVVSSQSLGIGSWFAARLSPAAGATTLYLLGKPTLNGLEVCSDQDVQFQSLGYACRDSSLRNDFAGWHLVSGREEADVIRGVTLDLRDQAQATARGGEVPPATQSL
jgi:hypothetical protein